VSDVTAPPEDCLADELLTCFDVTTQ
jgi:hypothetical protein